MFRIRLKKLREDAGYSQYSFADAFGVSQSAVGNWEAGKREPGYDTTRKLADFFSVSVDYLLDRTDDPNPPEKEKSSSRYRDEDIEALNILNSLPEEDRDQVFGLLRLLKSKSGKQLENDPPL